MANTVDLVLNRANYWVGYLEKKTGDKKYLYDKTANAGTANYTCFWDMLKPSWQGQAWCNCFVNAIFTEAYGEVKAKELLYTKGDWSYYTPTSAQYFKNNSAWYTSPVVGDIIYFKNSTRIHHVGIVRKVTSTTVYTIEGNTSSEAGVVANGGCVAYKSYSLFNSNIAGYGRPKYEIEESYVTENIDTGRAGLKVTTDTLNIRKSPSASAELVSSIRYGEYIFPTEKTTIDGVYWFKIASGWVCGKYLAGWIKQLNRWWYLDNGTYYYLTVKNIDGEYYAFDKDGWLIESSNIANDGHII